MESRSWAKKTTFHGDPEIRCPKVSRNPCADPNSVDFDWPPTRLNFLENDAKSFAGV
jgi:hypothetical protein